MANIPVFDPPEDVEFAAPFWEAIQREELRLPKCTVCGSWDWYPDDSGTCCPGGELVWERVAGTGTVHTFTSVQRRFLPTTEGEIPFTVAFIELDGVDGVRLVANVDHDDVTIGERVGVTFVDVKDRKHPVFAALATST